MERTANKKRQKTYLLRQGVGAHPFSSYPCRPEPRRRGERPSPSRGLSGRAAIVADGVGLRLVDGGGGPAGGRLAGGLEGGGREEDRHRGNLRLGGAPDAEG